MHLLVIAVPGRSQFGHFCLLFLQGGSLRTGKQSEWSDHDVKDACVSSAQSFVRAVTANGSAANILEPLAFKQPPLGLPFKGGRDWLLKQTLTNPDFCPKPPARSADRD